MGLESTLGQTLKAHRKAHGLSLSALARTAGVHKSTLSRWESGKSVPFTHELTDTLEALGLSDKERQWCYQRIEAPRSVQAAVADTQAAKLPISTGELLRALRLRAGITQSEAARTAGVSQSLILKWEKGDCWPSDSHLHILCFLYRTTDEEMVFLTTRAWRQIDPLPLDKDALDAITWYLEDHDSTPHRSGAYLALAARYQALFRAGKISEADANSVYGSYGYYLAWRLGRSQEGKQIAAPAKESLKRSRGRLTQGQKEVILLEIEHSEEREASAAENRDLLTAVAPRFTARDQSLYWDIYGQVQKQNDNWAGAVASYRKSISVASFHHEAVQRSDRLITLLCRHGRYREALPLLTPTPASEPRISIATENLLNHAWILAGLGDIREAHIYYARAKDRIRRHDFTNFTALDSTIVQLLSGSCSGV